MTPAQANDLIAYLRSGDSKCLLPETCDSPYCRAWKELIAYIRELEASQDCDEHWAAYQALEEVRAFRNRNAELIGELSEARHALANIKDAARKLHEATKVVL